MADQERARYFRKPESFFRAAVDGLKDRCGWEVIIDYQMMTAELHSAATVGRASYPPITVINIYSRQPRSSRNFALGWSVGFVVLTENLSKSPCDTSNPEVLNLTPLPLETPEFTTHLSTEDYSSVQGVWSRAAAFAACLLVNEPADDPDKEAAIASRLQVPRHLVGLYTRLQQIEEGARYRFIGLNPTEWAAGLRIHLRRI